MGLVVLVLLFMFPRLLLPISERFCAAEATTRTTSRNPALVWYTDMDTSTSKPLTCYNGSKVFECDVYTLAIAPEDPEAYLFNGCDIGRFPLPRDPKIIWGLFQTDSPKTQVMLMQEEALNLFNMSSTFSRYSDVPLPDIFFMKYRDIISTVFFVNTAKKNSFLKEIAPVVFFQRDCVTLTEREEYVRELNKYIKVDSYGGCHNPDLLSIYSLERDYFMEGVKFNILVARYKFIIAIENAVCVDYVTEKVWQAIELGVVPIYYGSPLIRDWLPNNKSAILLEDFPTPQLLSEHLHYLLNNDTAYEEYLEHKTLALVTNQKLKDYLVQKSNQTGTVEDFECLICVRIHDRNSTRVDIVTKKHYDCPTPKSALTLSVNPNSMWLRIIEKAKSAVDQMIKEIDTVRNGTRRNSETTWYYGGLGPCYRKEQLIEEMWQFE